jgi:hypothetical protein
LCNLELVSSEAPSVGRKVREDENGDNSDAHGHGALNWNDDQYPILRDAYQ